MPQNGKITVETQRGPNMLERIVKIMLKAMGYKISKIISFDMEEEFIDIYEKCKDYTMTSIERMYSLYKAVEYVVKFKIPGDIVECGVYKGGSLMTAASTLLRMGEKQKKIYLYDTYEGMSEPTDEDIRAMDNAIAKREARRDSQEKSYKKCCYASIEEVKRNMLSTGYPQENLIFVKGKVENTIPNTIPHKISLLRLDTDWYESIYHELNYLFPRLSRNGVIIIDDYGWWKGCKKATDKYFEENGIRIFLCRIDNTGRIGIKVND